MTMKSAILVDGSCFSVNKFSESDVKCEARQKGVDMKNWS